VQTAAFGAEETAAAEITNSPHVAPAERFEKRPNQLLLGLKLGRVLSFPKLGKRALSRVRKGSSAASSGRCQAVSFPILSIRKIAREKPTVLQCAFPLG
jgi:hypothetical protein